MIFAAETIWIYTGTLEENVFHRHFALQLTLSAGNPFTVDFEGESTEAKALLVRNNVPHRLNAENEIANILINPLSTPGHHFLSEMENRSWMVYESDPVKNISGLLQDLQNHKIPTSAFAEKTTSILKEFRCRCTPFHHGDERIDRAVLYMEEHFLEVIPAEELASVCSLSTDRFLHLFKEKTGITFQRFQIWNKLLQAGRCILSGKNLTDSAHEAGFADSAHFTRSFKETFGELPKKILQ